MRQTAAEGAELAAREDGLQEEQDTLRLAAIASWYLALRAATNDGK